MKISEIRDRTDDELKGLAEQLAEDLYRMRVNKATNQLEDTSSLRRMRREFARVRTVQRQRALGLEVARQPKDSSAKS